MKSNENVWISVHVPDNNMNNVKLLGVNIIYYTKYKNENCLCVDIYFSVSEHGSGYMVLMLILG